MEPPANESLAAGVGWALRRLRLAAGYTQDDVAAVLRRWGLNWQRSQVAMLEAGGRGLAVDEFLVIYLALRDWWTPSLRPELLLPDRFPVRLSPEVSLRPAALRDL